VLTTFFWSDESPRGYRCGAPSPARAPATIPITGFAGTAAAEGVEMLEAFGWGALASSSLLLGALIAMRFDVPVRVVGWVLGFGAGVLISALAFDLVQTAADVTSNSWNVVIGLFAGCAAFTVGDLLIARRGGARRKNAEGGHDEESAGAIVLGTVLDGVPESAVIGLTLVGGGEIGIAYLVAVFVSNLPEALSSTAGLRRSGWSTVRVVRLWVLVVLVSALSSAAGYQLLDDVSVNGQAFVLTFAAGAVLTMLSGTMLPEAYRFGGRATGVVATFGFAVAFALHQFA
jgi:ZIP family zinc transporter